METESREYISPILLDLVPKVTYKPGWTIDVKYEKDSDGSGGWTLSIISYTDNSLHPGSKIRVEHPFLIPAASYNRDTWAAWIYDRLRDVETHEAGEFFRINGVREFAPHHSNGENPYLVWHVSDYATAAKSSGDD